MLWSLFCESLMLINISACFLFIWSTFNLFLHYLNTFFWSAILMSKESEFSTRPLMKTSRTVCASCSVPFSTCKTWSPSCCCSLFCFNRSVCTQPFLFQVQIKQEAQTRFPFHHQSSSLRLKIQIVWQILVMSIWLLAQGKQLLTLNDFN